MFSLSRELVHSEAKAVGADMLDRQQALIVGGNAQLYRYSVEDERALIGIGKYDCDNGTEYPYPYRPENSVIDQRSVRLYADNVYLQIHQAYGGFTPDQEHYDRLVTEDECLMEDCVVGAVIDVKLDDLHFSAKVLGHAKDGDYYALVLSRNLPAPMRAADPAKMRFRACVVRHDIEIPVEAFDGQVDNWCARADHVVVGGGIYLADSGWIDDGEPHPLPIVEADFYIQYKAWRSEFADTVYALADGEDLDLIPGQESPANPLKFGVKMAKLHSNITAVKFIAVPDPDDPASWVETLRRAGKFRFYSVVPMTTDPAVQEAVIQLVDDRSQAATGRECVTWLPLQARATVAVADASNSVDGAPLKAVVREQPGGGAFLVDVQEGNAQFLSLGVQPGDILRYNVGENGYIEYVIHAVLNEDAVVVQDSQGIQPSDFAHPVEVWRTLDSDAMAARVAAKAKEYGSKRVRAVWPDRAIGGGVAFDGMYVCAALAGLRSGCAPHQSLAGVELAGIDELPRTDELFTEEQLEMLTDFGVWVVSADDGVARSLRGLTTAAYGDPSQHDEAVVTNLDCICGALRDELRSTIGKAHGAGQIQHHVIAKAHGQLNAMCVTRSPRVGRQLIDKTVRVVRRHAFLSNRLVLSLRLVVPVPQERGITAGNVEVYQQIIV